MELNKIHNVDCMEFMKTLPDKCVDLVVTDIPYNISQEHGGLREIDYGEWDKNISIETVLSWTDQIARITRGSIYIFCADQQFSHVFVALENKGMIVRKYEWLKTNPNVMNGQHFWLSSGELCVCAKYPSAFYNGNCEKAYKIFSSPTDRVHPTQKPVEIMEELIFRSSKEGDVVFDPFIGGGTTAVACKKLKRNFIGCEIEPIYFKIAQERIDSMTAQLF